uniref:Uncharacterized protein n=1 Tax=Meloidogyne incognita TaxID=6306 RepID=A0A914KPM8_MELIC
MMNLPKEELFAKLQSEPLSFFKNLKELPDEYATVVYEAFAMHWDRIDKKILHDRKILFGHRLVIEATLIAEIDHVLDIALKVSENLDPNNVSEDDGDNKIGSLRADSLYLSDVFFDVSEKYLKSYLGLPW